MTRAGLRFGRDRIPEPWEPPAEMPECAPGAHLIDEALERCTVCGWLDPEVTRCATQGCDVPGDYKAEVASRDDPDFTNVLQSARFCARHAFLGGIALVPGGPAA